MKARRMLVASLVMGLCGAVGSQCLAAGGARASDEASTKLWYDRPAGVWHEAAPVGNGRLGAMVFGGPTEERLQLNEDTLWSGGPHDYTNGEALKALPEARRLVFAGKGKQAERLYDEKMHGRPRKCQAYQPLGDLKLRFAGHEAAKGYRRELDLATAVASVRYRVGDATFTREVFASHPDQVIVVRVSCDKPGRVSFDAALTSPQPGAKTVGVGDDRLRLIGQLGLRKLPDGVSGARSWTAEWEGEGLRFEGRLAARAEGGRVLVKDGVLQVRDADAATLLLAAATSFVNYRDITADPAARAKRCLAAAGDKPYSKLRAAHVADHSRLFGRVRLDLGRSAAAKLPTDQRLKAYDPARDPALAALVFQYGRYLLIASSRPGSQAANLQGIWCKDLWPLWSSKWTININTQMNYWPAEAANLAECHGPLFDLVGDLLVTGGKTARVHYDCDGFVVHHNTDLWRAAAPVDAARYGAWPVGGAWLATHLWEHYAFGGDKAFLRRRAYPALKAAAEFYLDFLVEAPPGTPMAGKLVTCPTMSPEHGYRRDDGTASTVTHGTTMDIQIVNDIFAHCLAAAEILNVDPDLRAKVAAARKRLPPMQVGRHGQLQEWIGDWDNPRDRHSHVSHTYGLYPSNQITPATPKLLAGVRKSLELRGDKGGWPGAWRVCLWARLGDGEHAYKVLTGPSIERLGPNLFNGGSRFQIDANFGLTAGIAEMLLQSHAPSTVELLPAIPRAWADGSVTGLRARGGLTVDIAWNAGKLTSAVLRSTLTRRITVRYGGKAVDLSVRPGETYRFGPKLEREK